MMVVPHQEAQASPSRLVSPVAATPQVVTLQVAVQRAGTPQVAVPRVAAAVVVVVAADAAAEGVAEVKELSAFARIKE
jgi:hypothetical protein